MIIIQLILDILNISQKDFANQIGVTRQTVFMWLSGYKISQKNLLTISEHYNIPMSFLEKSQISGFQLNDDDIEYLKNCLLNNKQIYSENIINKLLNVIASNNCYKSNNLNDFINFNLNYNSIELFNSQDLKNKDDKSYYLIIVERDKRSILEISLSIENLGFNKEKSAYIIMDGKEDRISIIKFGGTNEISN